MAAGFVASVGLGFLILPAESRTYWLELLPDTSRIGGAGYVDNLSFKGAILHFAGSDFAVGLPWLVLSVAVVGVTAVLIRRASGRGEELPAVAATALLMLLISPVSWSHHWVWVPLFLAFLVRNLGDFTSAGTALGYGPAGLRCCGLSAVAQSIGFLMGPPNLDSQIPAPWLMASSVGVFWAAVGLVGWSFVALMDRKGRPPVVNGVHAESCALPRSRDATPTPPACPEQFKR
ncbi:DUF2029 domain-containing protein [Arthrobacter sp. Sa2CUA1]|uniref:DUF2029 domain-containing protein n=1 Tax=Arthrobacter gallicola TaxID=2762225 RepID=A0ABR8UV46_9MICC|nr:glycosyltransferase 87 family protein [Arthrobacter gallicola]MBD7996389.1 DUF2029 domain-containing protein [Arthrobacter gallicola]